MYVVYGVYLVMLHHRAPGSWVGWKRYVVQERRRLPAGLCVLMAHTLRAAVHGS